MSNTRNIPATLHFGAVPLTPVFHEGQPHLTAADIARALGYNRADSISRIYQRNAAEFSPEMALTVKLTVNGFGNGGAEREVRIFNARGCHLIAMLAQSSRAAEFRRWVLDVLEQHQQQRNPSPEQAIYHLNPEELFAYIEHALNRALPATAPASELLETQARELELSRKLIEAQEKLLAATGKKPKRKAVRPITSDEIAEMKRLRALGLPVAEIARRTGRNSGSISQLTRDVADTADLFAGTP